MEDDIAEQLIANILSISGFTVLQIYEDFIDNQEKKIKQAFVHKSYDVINNELLAVKGNIYV